MRILIEEYPYEAAVVKDILHGIDALENVEGRVSIHYVGYYYNTLLKDCVFILPKVLLKDGKELVFGKYTPEAIVNLDADNPLNVTILFSALTHIAALTYLCAVIINDKDYGKRKSKLPGGVRPLSAVLRDQGPSGVLCGLWSELRQIHELAAPPAVERKAGEDGSGGTAQGSQGADNRQAQQQSYREDGSETAGR